MLLEIPMRNGCSARPRATSWSSRSGTTPRTTSSGRLPTAPATERAHSPTTGRSHALPPPATEARDDERVTGAGVLWNSFGILRRCRHLLRIWSVVTMTRAPEFITFTGVDALTPLADMVALSRRYPVEWGVLFSPKHQGAANRYPALDTVNAMFQEIEGAKFGLHFAAHLCGSYARRIAAYGAAAEIPEINF